MKKLHRSKLKQLALVSTALLAIAFRASALTVSESTDYPNGLSFDFGAVSAGVLEIGQNIIFGALTGECHEIVGCDNQDSILITIDTGLQLNSIFVTTATTAGPTGYSVNFDMQDSSSSLDFIQHYLPLNSKSEIQIGSALNAGVYGLTVFGQSYSESGQDRLNYSIELNVSPIPIPSGAWLFSAGLAGLATFKRHSKK